MADKVTAGIKLMIMKAAVVVLFVFFIAMSCLNTSCKRKEVIETQLTRLQHKWKLTKSATDDNGSGVIDGYEIHPVDAGLDDEIEFKADFTGSQVVIINGATNTFPFTWSMDSKDSITRVGVGHNTVVYFLADISSSSMELVSKSSGILVAYFYSRK